MMFEHIENVNSYNCLLASVATLAKYYGRDYHMISGSDWKLSYDGCTGSKRLGEQIDVISQVDPTYRAKQFHGFIWEMEAFEECQINEETGCYKDYTYPFLVSVDLYCSKWSKVYQRHHFLHCIIVCDYNSKDQTYSCIDPYFQYAHYNVSREDLYLSIDKCGKLMLLELPEKNSVEDYIKAIREDIVMVNNDNENYTNLKRLANDILTKMDIHYEFDEYKNDLNAVPIMDRIRKVTMYRDAYSCMLDYVYKLFELKYLNDASSLIKQSVVLWKTIQGKLLKTYLTGSINSDREIIAQMINQIADIEKQAVDLILINE
ncbi:hypothetical protein [Bacillus sp. FJAT-27264]|uniref:hypothetical protein n=1 Tax=Paenibacillus sp. (strain DSM 101736 / FJAT-27264) TaxID=1850362 RepID=UPI001112021D|nr:hypothetical protein [Bacillus sp. FJAT-27264]